VHSQRCGSQSRQTEAIPTAWAEVEGEVEGEVVMSLTRDDVRKVSLLARLLLSEDELDKMTEQLGQIVGYVDQLSELDTDDVQPMAHAVELVNVFAEDEVRPSLPREDALANAPKRDDECFRVPAVLGD
jgi:aspartyl-tRNA(Asn)/glutamyl-tRNA(Gln) amidotransferase subunit C